MKECQDFAEEYGQVAEKLYGMIKVGAIDCYQEEELCEEFSVYSVPKILIFSENFADDGETFEGDMKANNIINAATRKMQNFVTSINEGNYDSFLQRDRTTKHKILLFTEKKATPTLYKALSKKYLDKLNLGEVKKSELSLVQRFGIEEFPTIIAIVNPETDGFETYEGEMNIDQLTKFMGNYAYSTPKKPVIDDFIELTEKKMKGGSSSVCGPKSSNVCAIIFTKGENYRKRLDELKGVISTFNQDPVSFVFIKSEDEPYIHQNVFGSSEAVLYKPKRNKYTTLPVNSLSELENSISDALGGGGSWTTAKELEFGREAVYEATEL